MIINFRTMQEQDPVDRWEALQPDSVARDRYAGYAARAGGPLVHYRRDADYDTNGHTGWYPARRRRRRAQQSGS